MGAILLWEISTWGKKRKIGRKDGRKSTMSTDCAVPSLLPSLANCLSLCHAARGQSRVWSSVPSCDVVSSNQASDFCPGIHSRLPSSLYDLSFPLKYEFWATSQSDDRGTLQEATKL